MKLERIPLEILVLLVDRAGDVVTRDEIVAKVWGKGIFFDTDNSIRGAIRKLRQVLKDDADAPRFIQTVTGQGYRFIASVISAEGGNGPGNYRPEGLTSGTAVHGLATESGRLVQSPSAPLAQQDTHPRPERQTGAESDRGARTWGARRGLVAGAVASLALLAVAYVATRHRPVDVPAPPKSGLSPCCR